MSMGRGFATRKAIIASAVVVALLFMITTIPKVINRGPRTTLPVAEQYIERISSKGLIIRDEKVYENHYEGEVFRVAIEGERVRVGAEIANVLSGHDLTAQKNELMEIEKKIELLESGTDWVVVDTISKLQSAVSTKDYETIHNLKGDMILQLDYLEGAVVEGTTISEDYLDTLRQRKNYLQSIIDKNVKRIYSSHSGIVSFDLDGLEDTLTIFDLSAVDPEMFESSFHLKEPTAAFRIIDSYDWILGLLVNGTNFEVGDSLEVILRSDEDNSFVLQAPIINISEKDGGTICFLKTNSLLEELYDFRHIEADIIKVKRNALKIPKEALTSKDGLKGVLVKEFYDVVRFRPIITVGEIDGYVYTELGDSYGYIELKDGIRRKTINIYTEILLDPDKYSEGEILE